MIAKILSSSSNFHGVKYNEKNIENKGGELVQIKNMPFNKNDVKMNDIRDYLREHSIAKMANKNTFKNLQFHAMISCKGRQKNKNQLKEIGDKWMKEMGYGKQPYISVFHGNTDNNHIHLVSTRVNLDNGKKINDSNEGRKALSAINKICNVEKKGKDIIDDLHLERFLKSYKYDSFVSLKNFLNSKNYKVYTDDKKNIRALKNENDYKTDRKEMTINNLISPEDKKRLQALIFKTLKNSSNDLYGKINKSNGKTYDIKSEVIKELKQKFGIEICPVISDGKAKNYTLVDHRNKSVYNGNSIFHSRNLFSDQISIISKERLAEANSFHTNDDKKIDFISNVYGIPKDEISFEFGKSEECESLKKIFKEDEEIDSFLAKTQTKIYTNGNGDSFIFNKEKGILEDAKDVFGHGQKQMNEEVSLENAELAKKPELQIVLNTLQGNTEFEGHDTDQKRKRKRKRRR